VICLKADLVAFVEAEKKEQLLTLPTLEQSTVTAYEEMELRPHSFFKLWMVVSGPLDFRTVWKEPPLHFEPVWTLWWRDKGDESVYSCQELSKYYLGRPAPSLVTV